MIVSFCLSDISTGKSKIKKRLRLKEAESHGGDAVFPSLDDSGLANAVRLCVSQPTLGAAQTFDTGLEESRSVSQPVYLSDADLLDGLQGPERCICSFSSVLPKPSEATDPASGSTLGRNTARKRKADDEPSDAGLDLQKLVELIDVALRTLICDNRRLPAAGSKGIKCLSKPVGPKLSDIAPALFSPGYHDVSPTPVLVISSSSLML